MNIRTTAGAVTGLRLALAFACILALGVSQALAQATFYTPSGVAVKTTFILYVADYDAVRKVEGNTVTTLAGPNDLTPPLHTCAIGYANGTGSNARFNYISSIIVGQQTGNIYVTEHTNNTVRKITPAGVVTTVAGQGPAMISTNPSVDGIGTAATFKHPSGIVIDSTEKYLYVTDSYDYSVRRITLSTSLVETITAHGGLSNPDGIAIDPANNNLLYIIEQGWGRIRKLDMTLYAGTPLAAASLPIVPPATFNFNHPVGVAIDAAGKIFVTNYSQVRAGSIPSPTKPVIAGGAAGYLDAPVGTNAKLSATSTGLALEPGGARVFVADQGNNVVRRVGAPPSYPVATYAGHAPGHPIGCADGTR